MDGSGALASPRFILVVDDEPLVAELATEALLSARFQAQLALSAQGALAVLSRIPTVDLLFTDVMMPEINGFRLAAMATILRPDLRVLYASGYPQQSRDLALAVNVHDRILEKPYRPGDLVSAVQSALGIAEAQEALARGS